MGGGKKLIINGKYTISNGTPANPHAKVYYLHGNEFKAPLLLIQMDSNIFHFADANKNFIVGNGGWGYVLNRTQ